MQKITVIIALIASIIFSPIKAEEVSKPMRLSSEEVLELLELFGDVFDKVREEYVTVPSDKELIEAAIRGMLSDLDPHSNFLSSDDFKEMQVQTRGEFGGLGIEVTIKDGLVSVVSPIDDTPAFKAGLKAGDYISHINGESVFGLTIKEAVDLMRGRPGTDITITILRKDAEEPFDVTITRDIIKIAATKGSAKGDVAYLRVSTFSEQTDSGIKEKFDNIKKEIGEENLKGAVLDLRNNPGGLLSQAIAVSNFFLNRGEIVSTRGRNIDEDRKYSATKGDILNGLPLVVLVNGGSASASEIVAGALQDHGRAIILGEKSFGKGSVQTIIPLSQESAMKVTTSRYFTPSGRSIQAEGVTPDVLVEQHELGKKDDKKSAFMRSEASLRGHLESIEEEAKAKELAEDKELALRNTIEESYQEDYQLGRAIDLVRSLYLFEVQQRNNGKNIEGSK